MRFKNLLRASALIGAMAAPFVALASLSPETMNGTDISGAFVYKSSNTPQALSLGTAFGTAFPWPMTFAGGVSTAFGTSTSVPNHLITAQTTAPVLTSCGSGTPAITGTDTAGIVTMGTSATGCVITFNVAYTSAPYCVVTWIATPLTSQSYVTAAASITLTQTSTSGNKAQYICIAQSGG